MLRIAIPLTENNDIDNHFGHCENFGIYTVINENEIFGVEILPSQPGCGCKSNMAAILAQKEVTVMLAGGIGQGAIDKLGAQGIKVIKGCSGNADEAAQKYLGGFLTDNGSVCSQHANNADGHICQHHH